MKYIFVDPSGSFNEGKGHTGIAIIKDNDWDTLKYKSISANAYPDRHSYWKAIMEEILKHVFIEDIETCPVENTKVIIENFMIRTNGFLLGKMPETIQFIGALSYKLENHGVKYTFQTPTQAKSRFKDEDLPRYIPNLEHRENGRFYFKGHQINDHIRDAFKHLLYFTKYRKD